MKIIDNNVIFSTGKEKYAHVGIIGLSPELEVFNGYDGPFHMPEALDFEEERLTKAEQIELAEYMINEWQKFKDQAK